MKTRPVERRIRLRPTEAAGLSLSQDAIEVAERRRNSCIADLAEAYIFPGNAKINLLDPEAGIILVMYDEQVTEQPKPTETAHGPEPVAAPAPDNPPGIAPDAPAAAGNGQAAPGGGP